MSHISKPWVLMLGGLSALFLVALPSAATSSRPALDQISFYPPIAEVQLVDDYVVRVNLSGLNASNQVVNVIGANFPCDCTKIEQGQLTLKPNSSELMTIRIVSDGFMESSEYIDLPIDVFTSIGVKRNAFILRFRRSVKCDGGSENPDELASPTPDPNA